MTFTNNRIVGEALTPLESRLLEILCSGAASSIARAHLATARWGGYEHEGCECFLVSTTPPHDSPIIDHDSGPFAMAEVADETQTLGLLELWVVDGRLHSVNYSPFGDVHSALPTPEDHTIALIQ